MEGISNKVLDNVILILVEDDLNLSAYVYKSLTEKGFTVLRGEYHKKDSRSNESFNPNWPTIFLYCGADIYKRNTALSKLHYKDHFISFRTIGVDASDGSQVRVIEITDHIELRTEVIDLSSSEIFQFLENSISTFIENQKRPHKEVFNDFIKFKPHQKQAGLQILNYFKETLDQKYPGNDVTVSIRQKGDIVVLVIESPEGEMEKIEKAFSDYGQVVVGEMKASEYLDDKIQVARLETQLDFSGAQLRATEKMLSIAQEEKLRLIEDKKYLQTQLSEVITGFIDLSSQMGKATLKTLDNQNIPEILASLDSLLSNKGKEEVEKELETLKIEKPTVWQSLLGHVYKIAQKATYDEASKGLIAMILAGG